MDVVILARGGGSMEDLWASTKKLSRAPSRPRTIPIISGVGHETDFTIADFVADVRASTPSAAAELVVQTRREFDKHITDLRENLASLIRYRLSHSSRRVHELSARRGFRRPLDLLRQQRQRSDEMTSRLALGLRARLEQSRKRFNVAHMRIVAFDFHKQIVRLRNRTSRFCRAHRTRPARAPGAKPAPPRRRAPAPGVLRLSPQNFHPAPAARTPPSRSRKRSERALRAKRERLERLRLQLEERSPLRVLERGYAIATDAAGNILRSAIK